MKPLVILAVLFAASSAAAQTLQKAPLQQPPTQQPAPQQQPLILDPKTWDLDRPATTPSSPFGSGSPSLQQRSTGPSFAPSIQTQPTPDSMPPDRRQEYVPTLRLKVPL
jgi:hypothetical protein